MQKLMGAVSRASPLILLVFMLIAATQLGIELGVTRATLLETLSRFSWLYVAVAAMGGTAVLSGLLHESLAPSETQSRKLDPKLGLSRGRWIMDVLNRLTNRAALEAMMSGAQQPSVIDAEVLARDLKAKVIGQEAVCDDLAAQIRRRMALAQRDKPIGVFLFAGPPGTGKTYLAKRLAIELKRKLLSLDMTQFGKAEAANQLFGAPKGYIGSTTYGALTGGLRESPDAVVLLDEIEKAHPEVHKRFLTAWNDGYVTEASDGKQISASRAIFMLTSNAATDELTDVGNRFADNPDEMRRTSMIILREAGFAPEVLNRIDRVFVFRALAGLDVARVAALEIEMMIENYGLEVADSGIDPVVLFDMMQRQQRMGASASARDLVRTIEETISDTLISAREKRAKKVALVADGGRIIAEIFD